MPTEKENVKGMNSDKGATTREVCVCAEDSHERRVFFQKAGAAAVIAAAGVIGASLLRPSSGFAPTAGWAASDSSADPLVRMQAELGRALAKPIEQRRWGMVIDIRNCIGCNACSIACIAENNLPPGVSYRKVYDEIDGDYPNLRRFFMPTNCYQCTNPPCVKAANAVNPGSMSVRPDGIVTIDYDRMKGRDVFETARKACPYEEHALYYDAGGNHTDGTPAVQPYEKRESVEYGRKQMRANTVGASRKCHFCVQRIEKGVLPACVTTCTGGAMHFGDLNDPAALVSELAERRKNTFVMKQGEGTGPRVIYLHDDPVNAENSCAKCHEGGNVR